MGPLRYQWFKDSKRLTVATSDTPLLVLVDVGVSDSGTYYCQVSNKDGAVCSSKALLNITRIGRVQHAAGAVTTAAEAGGSSGDQAASPLVGLACKLEVWWCQCPASVKQLTIAQLSLHVQIAFSVVTVQTMLRIQLLDTHLPKRLRFVPWSLLIL